MYVAKRYLTKYIYVCLGSKIPWICMYIANVLYVCLGSKIPHEKKQKNKQEQKIYLLVEKPTCF